MIAFSQMAFEQIINICRQSTDAHVAPSITFTKMALFLLLAQVAALLSAFDSFFRSFTFSPSVLKYTSLFCREKFCRSWQGSNLRGQSPLDFKSNALTTRPQLLVLCTREKIVEMRGIEPRAFHMQSERSTTELHPL